MKRLYTVMTVSAAMLMAATAPAHAALLDGKVVHADYRFPSQSTVFQDYGNHAISGTTLIKDDFASVASVFVADTGIYFRFNQGTGGFLNTSFNGFHIDDVNGAIDAFTSVALNSATNTLSPFDASRISFDANNIFVNFQGLAFRAGDVVSLSLNGGPGVSFDTPAVPEPATWAMMLVGFGMTGAVMRRRKRVAVAYA